TLLYVLSNAGCVVTVPRRSPEVVCAAIARHRVQLLPTSPTFLNLLLMSEAYKRHDLSSLEMVTYGTEVMPETTLERFHRLFSHVRLLQTYGLSEVGILRSQSKAADSLWVRACGDGFDRMVVDGTPQVGAGCGSSAGTSSRPSRSPRRWSWWTRRCTVSGSRRCGGSREEPSARDRRRQPARRGRNHRSASRAARARAHGASRRALPPTVLLR